jgi:hypothetical protein
VLKQWFLKMTLVPISTRQLVNGAVEATVTKRATITELVPKDQFWNHTWKNITFSYDLTPLEGVDRNTAFGWESLHRWFEVHFVNGVLNLVRVEDGQVPLNIFEQYPMKNGQTYRVSITLQDQTITVKVDNQVVSQTQYQDYVSQGGKIGLKAGTGAVYPTKLRYDNVEVIWHQPASTQLNVPLFKQTDQRWATTIYDHGTNWSTQPTISRWGCLVSSIAMVMNYHGLNKMVDGSQLTPATLNAWLTTQPDGYIGEGLVNWQAVTRLTKQLSEVLGTPKLEYSRVAGSSLSSTIEFITKKYPSILEVTGHFLVGTGFTNDRQDLLINDPAYDYTRLSQHSTPLKSTRLLTPSYTDLSYLLITHDPQLEVGLTSSDGSVIPNLEKFTESLAAAPNGEPNATTAVIQLAKPESADFTLTVTQPQPGPFKVTVFAYDQAAQLTDLSLSGWAGPALQTFRLNYQKNGSSSISSQTSWNDLKLAITNLEQAGLFGKKTTANQLISLADQAEQEPVVKQLQRVSQLKKVSTAFNGWLSPHTLTYLHYLLQQLSQTISSQASF